MGLKTMFRSLIIGAGAGAAVVYLNDPQKGQQRRDQLRRKASATAEDARGMIEQVKDSDVAAQMSDRAAEIKSSAADKAEEIKSSAAGKVEEARDQHSGDGTTGRDQTVDLTIGTPMGSSTSLPADDLILPGDRPT